MENQSSTALAINKPADLAQFGEMSVASIVARKKKINEVMKEVMRDGEHFGRIPGVEKPSLLKAGAEVLATTFGLAPTFKITQTDLASGHREYQIVCTLHHIATGAVVGEGVGSCSTMESKYRWRNGGRQCPECGRDAIIKSKFDDAGWFCFEKKGGCGAKFPLNTPGIDDQKLGRTENPDIADTYNTVLKMAKKRAQVDCTLTAVGASDILTQDVEDNPPEDGGRARGAAPAKPAAKPTKGGKAKPLTNDETDDLVEQIAKTSSEDALRELVRRHAARVQASDDDIKERLRRVLEEQYAQVRAPKDVAKAAEPAAAPVEQKAS